VAQTLLSVPLTLRFAPTSPEGEVI